MIFARKVDANHKVITERFRQHGVQVIDTSRIGQGFPDLLVNLFCKTYLIEIKGEKGKLTEDQLKFHADWRGPPVVVIRNIGDVDGFVGRARTQLFQ